MPAGLEIERKYLVDHNWMQQLTTEKIVMKYNLAQGYLNTDPSHTVRVRLNSSTNTAYLTIKGLRTGISCPEFEYQIPYDEADQLLDMCQYVILKTRYVVQVHALTWEVDVFLGNHDGLIIAEIELESKDVIVPTPSWVGTEVSTDNRYTNLYLAKMPQYNPALFEE